MWTTESDIENRWLSGKPLPESTKLETLIGDVEAQILERWSDADEQVSADPEIEKSVVRFVSNIVIEFLQTEGTAAHLIQQGYSGIGHSNLTYRDNARYDLVLSEYDFGLLPLKSQSEVGNVKIVVFERPRKPFGGCGKQKRW